MSNENIRELHRTLSAAQSKHTYFLLTAAASATAFAVIRSEGATVAWSQIPLALAVVAWGTSFLAGCRYTAYANSTMLSNVEMLKIEAGTHPDVGPHPQMVAKASQDIRLAIASKLDTADRLGRGQFRFLVAGFALYVVWHVLEMVLRSVP